MGTQSLHPGEERPLGSVTTLRFLSGVSKCILLSSLCTIQPGQHAVIALRYLQCINQCALANIAAAYVAHVHYAAPGVCCRCSDVIHSLYVCPLNAQVLHTRIYAYAFWNCTLCLAVLQPHTWIWLQLILACAEHAGHTGKQSGAHA